MGGEGDGLLAAAALAVHGGAGHGLGEAGAEQSVAGDVDGLVADLGHRARDDVVDGGGIHSGAVDQLAQAVCEQVGGQHVVKCTARLALADGGAYGPHDDGVAVRILGHVVLLLTRC